MLRATSIVLLLGALLTPAGAAAAGDKKCDCTHFPLRPRDCVKVCRDQANGDVGDLSGLPSTAGELPLVALAGLAAGAAALALRARRAAS